MCPCVFVSVRLFRFKTPRITTDYWLYTLILEPVFHTLPYFDMAKYLLDADMASALTSRQGPCILCITPFKLKKTKMDNFLYENYWGSPTLTWPNVLNVLNVLNKLNVLNLLKRPKDSSLACWALFFFFLFFLGLVRRLKGAIE